MISTQALEKFTELMCEKIRAVSKSDYTTPWFSPNSCGIPQNLTGRPYNNFNRVLLYVHMEKMSYSTPVYVTIGQIKNLNLMINKGTKSVPVIFYELTFTDKNGNKIDREKYNSLSKHEQKEYTVRPFMKYYNVFNIEQTNYASKYPEKWSQLQEKFLPSMDLPDGIRNAYLDNTIDNQTWICPIELKNQNEAFYRPSENKIILPLREQFNSMESFYSTALHEMAHSTGPVLKREFGIFGSPTYAKEELIAELSSAVTGKDLGISMLPTKESAAYMKSWLSAIDDDPKYLMNILTQVGKSSSMIEEKIGFNESLINNEVDLPHMIDNDIRQYKGGIRTLEINGEKAVIRTNNKEYDATGILDYLKKAGIDKNNVTPEQWKCMLRGKGTALDPNCPKKLFSVQKHNSGYGLRSLITSTKSMKVTDKEL